MFLPCALGYLKHFSVYNVQYYVLPVFCISYQIIL